MPGVIDLVDDTVATLAETCDGLSAMGVDFDDPERLDNAARWLRRLGNDKQFLGDVLVAELAQRHAWKCRSRGLGTGRASSRAQPRARRCRAG